MSTIGLHCTKDYLYLAHLSGTSKIPVVLDRISIDAGDWPSFEKCLDAQVRSLIANGATVKARFFQCSTGKYSSSPEAFKAEGISECLLQKGGIAYKLVSAQRVKSVLKCDKDEDWKDKARATLDPSKNIKYFSVGNAAAMAVTLT